MCAYKGNNIGVCMGKKPRILSFDIETAPNLGFVWQLWTEIRSMDMIDKDWYILCWCAKWLDEDEMIRGSLFNNEDYDTKPQNDKIILKKLWKLLDEADIVIAQNGIKFDRKKVNARFIMNGMKPPSPYKMVDTLRVARQHFAFTSNRLADLGKFLKLGTKVQTGGMKLWVDCMLGKQKAWDKMLKYCDRDVVLLEKIYKKLLPYITNHPNIGTYLDENAKCCPNCGSKNLQKRGTAYTSVASYQRYRCNGCGAWSRGTKNTKKNKVQLRSITG